MGIYTKIAVYLIEYAVLAIAKEKIRLSKT
jgi:hypothetical protein